MGKKKVSEFVGLDKIEADSLVSCSACGAVWDSGTGDVCPVCSLKPLSANPENPGEQANPDFDDWD